MIYGQFQLKKMKSFGDLELESCSDNRETHIRLKSILLTFEQSIS